MAEPNQIDEVRELRQRVAQLERAQQASRLSFTDGAGTLRVRVGRQDDGAWGLRVWTSAGALAIDETTGL